MSFVECESSYDMQCQKTHILEVQKSALCKVWESIFSMFAIAFSNSTIFFTVFSTIVSVYDAYTCAHMSHRVPKRISIPLVLICVYGVASVSRIDKITGLFRKRGLWKRRCFAKETYNFKEPTNRSHSIPLNTSSINTTGATVGLGVIWLIHMLYITRWFGRRLSIQVCGMPHSFVCDVTRLYIWDPLSL